MFLIRVKRKKVTWFYVYLNLIARKYKMTISSTKTKSMAMWGNHNGTPLEPYSKKI